jgi:hypothetical protein
LFWIFANPGSHKKVQLSLESICAIPFQAGASEVKMPKLRQQSSYRVMACFVNVFGAFQGTCDQSNENPGALFKCPLDIISNINNREIQWPGILIARKIGEVSLVGCTYDWYNRRSSRKLILCIAPPVALIHPAVDSMTLRVSKAHRFKIEVCLKWEMC